MFFVSCVSHAFASVHCCLVVSCWERVDLLALVGDVYCIFVTFPCDILGQVWYLIVLIPGLFLLFYFNNTNLVTKVNVEFFHSQLKNQITKMLLTSILIYIPLKAIFTSALRPQ